MFRNLKVGGLIELREVRLSDRQLELRVKKKGE